MNADISLVERVLLSCIKEKPCIFMDTDKLFLNLEHYLIGYNSAMYYLGIKNEHSIIPDAFGEYIAEKYECPYTATLFSIIRDHSSDEEASFDLFFDLLDEYLLSNGYYALPKCTSITRSIQLLESFREQAQSPKSSDE